MATRNSMLKACLPLLREANLYPPMVTPENLIQAAYLVECHYFIAENDIDGVRLLITKQGLKILEKNP